MKISVTDYNSIKMAKILISAILILLSGYSFSQEIDSLIAKNQYDEALRQIDSDLLINDSRPLHYLKKGTILQKRYDYSGALLCFEKAYQLDSANISVINELAEVNTSLGNYRQALPFYNILYKKDSTNSVAALKLARAYFNCRAYKEPFAILQSAYLRDSSKVYLNKQLAFSAMRTGHDSLAIHLYDKVIHQNPADLNNYINLSNLYQKKENYPKTVETLERGLLVYPEEPLLLIKLGDTHFSKRKYPNAARIYERCRTIDDSNPEVMKNLGVSYYYEKRVKEGLELLETFLTYKPNDPVAGLFIGLCYKELKEYEASIAYLNFAAKIAVPYYVSDIYNQLGNIYCDQKEYKKSVRQLKKAYTLDSTKCDILFKIGNTYDVWQKDKSPALRYYNAFLNSKKEDNEYFKNLTEYVQDRTKKISK
jgi:tetratricopeptide (TPR) repeat protein